MVLVAVGQPYPEGKPPYAPGAQFSWSKDEMFLELRFEQPSQDEVRAVKSGEAEFALVIYESVIFLLYRFGEGIPWGDAPYSIHLVPSEYQPDPAIFLTKRTRFILTTCLFDSLTGIVGAIRALSFSPEFSRALGQAVQAQRMAKWIGREAYGRTLAAAYQKWPTPEAMLGSALAKCIGGK